MASAANPTGRPVSPASTGGAPDSPTKGYVATGMGAVRDGFTSAAKIEWRAKGASLFYTVVGSPISWVWHKLTGAVSWVLDKIYGPGRVAATTVTIDEKGWLWGTSPNTYSLDYALERKKILPQEALDKHLCQPAYLTARGYDIVEFTYSNWRGADTQYKGKLRSAIRDHYITIDEAISQGFITKAQAIEGGFLKADKPAKTTK